MADVVAKFSEAEIVPNIIPNAPKNLLNMNYEGVPVEPGCTLSTRNLRFAPRLTFASNPEATYSMVMIDPDNLSRQKPTVAEWLHWLVLNIPASNINEGIMGGQTLMAYGSPAPGPRTGLHRYVVLLYEHEGKRVAHATPGQRAKFKVKAFQEKHTLEPIAGNFFFAQNEQQ